MTVAPPNFICMSVCVYVCIYVCMYVSLSVSGLCIGYYGSDFGEIGIVGIKTCPIEYVTTSRNIGLVMTSL